MRRMALIMAGILTSGPMWAQQVKPGSQDVKLLERAVKSAEDQAAYDSALEDALPLTPEEIRAFRQRFDATSRAAAAPPGKPPKLRTSIATVSLQPGAEIPSVLIYQGLFSAISLLDKSGQPWPIETVSGVGDGNQVFKVTHPQPHIVEVSAKVPYAVANLSLTLADLPTPVSINLLMGATELHDSRKDLHIDACGPLCQEAPVTPEPGLSPLLYDLLDGIPPPGAERRTVQGSSATDIWEKDGQFYVRTQEILLSPACLPHQQARSLDGTRACIIPRIPMLLVSRQGRQARIRIE
jgi:intracellular multiplication protein IcmK